MTVFAGDRIEQFMNRNKPDYGGLGSALESYGSAERVADTELEAKIEAAQMTADAQVKAAKLTGQGYSAQADASVFGSAMGALGKIGSAGIGAIPTGGSGIGTGANFGEVGTSGSDLADFGYTPEQDKAFHNGGIDYGWL